MRFLCDCADDERYAELGFICDAKKSAALREPLETALAEAFCGSDLSSLISRTERAETEAALRGCTDFQREFAAERFAAAALTLERDADENRNEVTTRSKLYVALSVLGGIAAAIIIM